MTWLAHSDASSYIGSPDIPNALRHGQTLKIVSTDTPGKMLLHSHRRDDACACQPTAATPQAEARLVVHLLPSVGHHRDQAQGRRA